MKKIILGMAAISMLAVAAPAAAQYGNNVNQNGVNVAGNFVERIAMLRNRLQTGVQSGTITRQEAWPIRQQLQQLTLLERRYSVNGISDPERAALQQRVRTVRQQLRTADGGSQARWDQDDREDGYGQNGRYTGRDDDGRDGRYSQDDRSGRMDRNRDGYDDRDLDRDGRWDDDQRSGAYAQPEQRGGLAGLVDTLIGGGALRVGQRAPDNLYGVPSEYGGQYRDSNSVYYRSDGRQIYQIDARNDTVVRVYPMSR